MEAGGLGGLRNEQPHRTRAGETGFRLTDWTDFTIFQVLTGGGGAGGLSQLPDPSEMHNGRLPLAITHTLTLCTWYHLHNRQVGGSRTSEVNQMRP